MISLSGDAGRQRNGHRQRRPGTNTLDFSESGSQVAVDLATDSATTVAGFTNIENIIGGTAPNLLVGPNTDPVWDLTGHNAGSVGGVNFTNFQNLQGGTDGSTFLIATAGSLDGSITGGGPSNILNYSTFSGNVFVDLLLNQATAVARASRIFRPSLEASVMTCSSGTRGPPSSLAERVAIFSSEIPGTETLIGGGGDNILIGLINPLRVQTMPATQALFSQVDALDFNFNQRIADLVARLQNEPQRKRPTYAVHRDGRQR